MCSYTPYSFVPVFILSRPLERSSVGLGTVWSCSLSETRIPEVGWPGTRGLLAVRESAHNKIHQMTKETKYTEI